MAKNIKLIKYQIFECFQSFIVTGDVQFDSDLQLRWSDDT